jgi:hypothetical protein
VLNAKGEKLGPKQMDQPTTCEICEISKNAELEALYLIQLFYCKIVLL